MGEKKYLLCVNLVIDGEKMSVQLAKASLKALLKYTSYCKDFNHLCATLEKSSASEEAVFLLKYGDSSNPIIIKNSKSNFETKELYNDDLDIVLFNAEDLKKIFDHYSVLHDKSSIYSEMKEYIFDVLLPDLDILPWENPLEIAYPYIIKDEELMFKFGRFLKYQTKIILIEDFHDNKENNERDVRLSLLSSELSRRGEDNKAIVNQIKSNIKNFSKQLESKREKTGIKDLQDWIEKQKRLASNKGLTKKQIDLLKEAGFLTDKFIIPSSTTKKIDKDWFKKYESACIKIKPKAPFSDEDLLSFYISQNKDGSTPELERRISLLREKIKLNKKIDEVISVPIDTNNSFELSELRKKMEETEEELDLLDSGLVRFSDAGFLIIDEEKNDPYGK